MLILGMNSSVPCGDPFPFSSHGQQQTASVRTFYHILSFGHSVLFGDGSNLVFFAISKPIKNEPQVFAFWRDVYTIPNGRFIGLFMLLAPNLPVTFEIDNQSDFTFWFGGMLTWSYLIGN